jgi:DNA-binding MarR family transcriptional regulator/GNAT superfamily N-acetyltransferase
LAGTGLSPSAAHAVYEIGAAKQITAGQLAEKLRLEKSTVSRLTAVLRQRGLIVEHRTARDARLKNLDLTPEGRKALQTVNRLATRQVKAALAPLAKTARQSVRDGLEIYAAAMAGDSPAPIAACPKIRAAYEPGLIGRITEMQAAYYSVLVGFGLEFESKVANELAEFLSRLDAAENQIWSVRHQGRIAASIVIDGQDLGGNCGHLRWFIVDDSLRGTGMGGALLQAAINFCDDRGFMQTHLWTFKGLDAARSLYERNGFVLAEEMPGRQWGAEVLEQKFIRRMP